MKIGQVSKKYQISSDTLYYYINYGLLVPKRPKGRYIFDTKTLNDLEMIIKLKGMKFSLNDIHKILSLHRISGLAVRQDIEDLKKIYSIKISDLENEKVNIENKIDDLRNEVFVLENMISDPDSEIGLPVSMLDLLCCPECEKDFSLENVNMDLRYIFSGDLICQCGYRASINNGILITPNRNKDFYDTPDTERKLYKDLPPSLISLFQKSYNWMLEQLEKIPMQNKVVMETYINAWFFIHNHQQYLHPKGKYIVVDKYPEMLRMYKELMEKQKYHLDILYLADSSTDFPLKNGSVDLNIDYFAVNEHNFYHNTFLYEELKPYFNENSIALGTYFYFQNGKKSMNNLLKEYPTCYERNFDLKYFLDNMQGKILDQNDCGYTESSGANIGFSFHSEGERMYLRSYLSRAR